MSEQTMKSPINGKNVPFKTRHETKTFYCYDHSGFGFGDLYITEDLINREPSCQIGARSYSEEETRAGWALIRSKLWRAAAVPGSPPLCISSEQWLESYEQRRQELDTTQNFDILSLESQIEEAKQLDFTTRVLRTLESVFLWQCHQQSPVRPPSFPVSLMTAPMMYAARSDEDGMAYGATDDMAGFVYEYAVEQGWLREVDQGGYFAGIQLTGKGYVEVERLHRGEQVNVREGFLICRLNPELEDFFRPVRTQIAERTGCKIDPVWTEPHNEKVDERILRKIRAATVVVVDVDNESFNVGFEAGFAMALDKPIIAIRDRARGQDADGKEAPMPFDISTLNCFTYDRDQPDALVNRVSECILAAIDEMKRRSSAV